MKKNMKKLINKILASMLTMAMIIGMFAGVGLEAKAEEGAPWQLDIYVQEGNTPKQGIQLKLVNVNDSQDMHELDVTDNYGYTYYDSFDDITNDSTYRVELIWK